jgi:hypothetical protein
MKRVPGPGRPRSWPSKEVGAADDSQLLTAAKALMELIDQNGVKSGKYNVTIKDSKGVQVGDGNIQVNRF